MPTGYTHAVCDGKITEFPEFALTCARAFGALIVMRDDPMEKPIPDEIAPETSFYDKKLAEDKRRLREVQAMTNVEAEEAARTEYADAVKSRAKYLSDQEAEAERLNSMVMKVRQWEPPTPDHVGMKEFMLEQLRISLPGNYVPDSPIALDGKVWRKKEIDRLADAIVRSQKYCDEEIERAAGRTKWVKALRESLAPAFADQ